MRDLRIIARNGKDCINFHKNLDGDVIIHTFDEGLGIVAINKEDIKELVDFLIAEEKE